MTVSPIPAPQAVIFDWDGTLVDTLTLMRQAQNHVRTLWGFVEWEEEDFHRHMRLSSRELFPTIYGDDAPRALAALYDYIGTHHLDHLTIFPDADNLTQYLADHNISQAVVSNKRHEYLCREVDHVGWQDKFFCVLGGGQAERDKPSAAPVLMALKQCLSPLEAAHTWFVGDTETDMLTAAAAGCPAVLITHGKDRKALIDQYQPLVVADNCTHLMAILREAI